MVSSGIPVDQEIVDAWHKVTSRKARFIVMKMSDDNSHVQLDHMGERNAECEDLKQHVEDMKKHVPENEARFIGMDFSFHEDDRLVEKLIFIFYNPDTISTKQRIPSANAKQDVENKCSSLKKSLNINAYADISYDYIKGEF